MALFFVVLIGSMAIATDLSVSTHYKRNIQNVTDAAALAGAKLLPATPTLSDEQAATSAALALLHNSFPWTPNGVGWANNLASAGCSGVQCSVSVCTPAMVSLAPGCTPVTSTTGAQFAITVNAPPKTALVIGFDGKARYIEVVMHQKSGAFFTGLFGSSLDQDGAQSVAYHFAANQPFGFALYSRTVIGDGNAPEIINGNVYAARYLSPQSTGKAAICAGPDSHGNPGYIVLGFPQGPDVGSYQNDGQSNDQSNVQKAADPIIDGLACSIANPPSAGTVAMSANPVNTAGCQAAYPGSTSLVWDATDQACEANPPISPPPVAQPSIPSVATVPLYCGTGGLNGAGSYQPGYYNCGSGTSLTVGNQPMIPGIYQIEANSKSGCDVVIAPSGNVNLIGVTFYLMHGAGMCVNPPSGTTINQTPFVCACGPGGTVAPGDGVYDVLSDSAGNPTITMNTVGGGSTSGIWQLSGVIWLPSGTVNISNKDALVDSGQVIVNTWNDQSGYHPNPSVSYNAGIAPPQFEKLQLSE